MTDSFAETYDGEEVSARRRDVSAKVIDLDHVLDDRPISLFQIRIFLLCGLVGILDGLNTQSIGVAAKSMAVAFHISMASFGPVFAAALLGASLGAIVFGPLGDRFGRKQPILAAMLLMAVFTLLTPLVHSITNLIIVRFLLGIGLGGATPCFIALGAEYAPERLRQRISALLWLGFPVGITLSAFLNAYLISRYHWPVLFYVGGMAPVLLLLLILFGLPESIRFLVARDKKPAAIAAIMRRLAPDLAFTTGTKFIAPHERVEPGSGELPLRGPGVLVTFALWLSFFAVFGALIVITLWGPALLEQNGMPVAKAAVAVGFDGFGALFGIAFAGVLLDRYGKMALIATLALGVLCILAIGFSGNAFVPVTIFMTVTGFFLGLASSGGIALAVQLYPVATRSRGVGWAMGAGRFGQFIAPLCIGFLVLKLWPVVAIFAAIAAMPALGAVFMLPIRNNAER